MIRKKNTVRNGIRGLPTAALIFISLMAGQATATSIFSMNLLGERIESGDARAIALGGSFQMVLDSLGVLQQNPAMLTYCRKVTVGAGQLFAMDKGRSETSTERDVSVSYPVFMGAFPITKYLTLGIGYRGKNDPDGTFTLSGTTNSGTDYRRIFSKSGGLYSVPLTLAVTFSRYAALGMSYTLEKGSIEDRWDVTFEDITFMPGAGLKREELNGSGYGVGVLMFPGGPLMVGATYESEVEYDVNIKERFTEPALDTNYVQSAKVPPRLSVALTWRITPSWHALASYVTADFTKFEGLDFPSDRLYREESIAIGAEYTKGIPLKGKRFPLRFSFNYQRLPYDFPAGERIRKIMFGFGTGLNLGSGKAKMDIALRVGKVGSLSNNTMEDRLVRLYVSVTGSEVWKRKGETELR
jgi:long-subunit fatty acid transport protein